ncbi:hypothetical protein RhiirA5_432097 [Rhizophagus irregularis]|uniref:Uncharacterized protein n=1 Tax=Rhizophagus irregularis TaxID=588596 RepID=A0A2N0NTX0_9GLOM|nr:hypothetical protein RhiirA5_432097 [Rhizophagus irregularis]
MTDLTSFNKLYRLFKNNFVNRITININNKQSKNTLHHGKHTLKAGNKLTIPLPATLTYYRGSKSTIEKACGIVTYEIDEKHKNNSPLLLIVGWRITITGKNKWFVFIGCEEDPDFPGEDISSVNEYLKENGNMGSDTLDFEEHSMTIEGSISDG